MIKMQIISSCTIISMLVFNMLRSGRGNEDWSITFNPPEITAVPGICALISCTFTYPEETKPIKNIQWRECDGNNRCEKEIFRGKVGTLYENQLEEKEIETERIKMLEPDLTKNNCSFIMKDMKAQDESKYAFRLEGDGANRSTYKTRVKITIQDEPIIEVPPLSEGVEANLTCSAPFPCPELPPETTWWIKIRGENISDLQYDTIALTTNKILSTLTLTPTSKIHNATIVCEVTYGNKTISTSRTLEVMYVQTLQILGNNTVMEGETLRLKCTIESRPPSSDPVWSFNGSADKIRNHTSAEYLTIPNVTKEHDGKYFCEIIYRNETLKADIDVKVIHNSTESFRPGAENGLVNKTTENTVLENIMKKLDIFTILTFVAGMACSAIIFSMILCFWVSCHRGKKHKVPRENPDADVNLETVQTDVAQSGTNEHTPLHGQLDGEIPDTAAPTDGAEEDEAAEMQARDVDYASIDYSLLKNRPPEEGEKEPTDTDYAEIKRDKRGDGKQREALEDGDEQIETPNQKPVEGEEELYSNSQVLKSKGAKEP